MTSARPAGRPRRSSRATLEEAAAELFLEHTYAATTVEQIAQRAGVSRATFFNYFASKADLLWAGLDDTLREAGAAVAGVGAGGAPVDAVVEAIATGAGGAPVDAVVEAIATAARSRGEGWLPLALTQHEVMGLGADVAGEGVARAAPLVDPVAQALARATGRRASDGPVRVAASVVAAATAAAVMAWAADGVGRGPLEDAVRRALDPLRPALAASVAAS
ncbi:TetR/AcrR family transcriptional regulator [Clavibacter sp. Sh2036]|uniref:TetR/AcrR family transcriptional regulator n=1 Tax=Clavibacter sp. Sh2036 TaxID=3397677 RepID=UPI0039E0FBBB